jgi:hypothetical protein
LATALKTRPIDANVMPTRPSTGSARSIVGERLMPSRKITTRIAAQENSALIAAHSISAKTMSSSATGAFRIESHVFCTAMREYTE